MKIKETSVDISRCRFMGSNFSAVIFTSAFIGGQRPCDCVDTSGALGQALQMVCMGYWLTFNTSTLLSIGVLMFFKFV
jgi:hypothetical protein